MGARRIMPTSEFIKRYLKANKISQKELANASGYTEKQVSLIMNGEVAVSKRFAHAIATCIPGLSEEYILRYANRYEEQVKQDLLFLELNEYKKYSKEMNFNKVFKHITSDPVEQIKLVLNSFKMNTIQEVWSNIQTKSDLLPVFYSKDISKLSDKDNIIVKLWTKIVINEMLNASDERVFVGKENVKIILEDNKDLLAVSNSKDLILNIEYICKKCGIYVAFSHTAPTTYIRGLSFTSDKKVFIVLTDRFKRVENVIFAFVHELEHIIRGDVDISTEIIRFIDLDEFNEKDVDEATSEFIVPQHIYDKYIFSNKTPSITDLINVANESNTTIGLVVLKYHHDSEEYSRFWEFLNPFKIEVDIFGNYD